MSVDIFGRSNSNSVVIQKGAPGIGFKYLDDLGNFDIGNKRLANVKFPVELTDAATKDYVDRIADLNHANSIRKVEELESVMNSKFAASDKVCSSNKSQITQLNQKSVDIAINTSNIRSVRESIENLKTKFEDDMIINSIADIDSKLKETNTTVETQGSILGELSDDVLLNSQETADLKEKVYNEIVPLFNDKATTEQVNSLLSPLQETIARLTERVDRLIKSNIDSALSN